MNLVVEHFGVVTMRCHTFVDRAINPAEGIDGTADTRDSRGLSRVCQRSADFVVHDSAVICLYLSNSGMARFIVGVSTVLPVGAV